MSCNTLNVTKNNSLNSNQAKVISGSSKQTVEKIKALIKNPKTVTFASKTRMKNFIPIG